MEHFDVLIIGAGPAGCAAAMRLPPGMRALLVDRGDPAQGRCCGGLLAPDAQRALGRLGLVLPEDVRVRPEPKAVHVRDLDSGREQHYARDYVNVDRARLDAWLAGLAGARAEFRPHARLVDLARTGEGIEARLVRQGRIETVRSRVVIGADGALSAVRRAAFPSRPPCPAMLAIQARLEAASPPEAHEVVFSGHLTDFYAWAIPKPGGVLVGAAFSDLARARDRFEAILDAMRRAVGLEGAEIERSARRLTRPGRREHLLAGDARMLLAGEAAGLVSPSSGEGLSFALESGAAAGAAAGTDAPGRAYRPAFARQARRVVRKFLKARVIFSPQWRRLALRLSWCP